MNPAGQKLMLVKTKENHFTAEGCIYKHPTCNLEQFRSQLSNIIKILNPSRHEIYILGDINIDFLKYNHHSQTEEFLDTTLYGFRQWYPTNYYKTYKNY